MSRLDNHVQLIGNVDSAPRIKTLDNGQRAARFSLATTVYYKDKTGKRTQETEWHNIAAFGRTMDIVEQYVSKGREVGVSGRLRIRRYTDQEGTTHHVIEMIADEILLLGSKNG